MTDTTAGASTPPDQEPESVTDDPAPPTTPEDSTSTDEGVVPRTVVGIDSTVEQGNRVTLTTPNLTTDPIGDLKTRIKTHFDEATVVVAELRATIDELDALLNKVRTGL